MACGDLAAVHVLREYALITGGERGVLVGPDRVNNWLCSPRWDSAAVFASLIGGGGGYQVAQLDRAVWRGYDEPGGLIWRSRWTTSIVRAGQHHDLVLELTVSDERPHDLVLAPFTAPEVTAPDADRAWAAVGPRGRRRRDRLVRADPGRGRTAGTADRGVRRRPAAAWQPASRLRPRPAHSYGLPAWTGPACTLWSPR